MLYKAKQNNLNKKRIPWFKSPISIENKIANMIFEDIFLLGMKFQQIKHTNDELVIGWSRCQDFKRMHLAERWVPGKTLCVFTSFWVPNNIWSANFNQERTVFSPAVYQICRNFDVIWAAKGLTCTNVGAAKCLNLAQFHTILAIDKTYFGLD